MAQEDTNSGKSEAFGQIPSHLQREIRELFVLETRVDIDAIFVALRQCEWQGLFHHAHRIRGRAQVVGLNTLAGLCAEIEESLSRTEHASIATLCTKLQKAFEDSVFASTKN